MTKKITHLLVAFFLLSASTPTWAQCKQTLAELVRKEGQVSIKPAGKVLRVIPNKLPYALCFGDEVHTFNGRAEIISRAQDSIVMDMNSRLLIEAQGSAGLIQGKVLFDVQKRTVSTPVKVTTRLSVIGVKGTRFLVDDQGTALTVAMDEGEVEVSPHTGSIQWYQESPPLVQEEFVAFKKEAEMAIAKEKQDFEAYKAEMQREYLGFVNQIPLAAGSVLEMGLEQDVATTRPLDGRNKAEMIRLMAWRLEK